MGPVCRTIVIVGGLVSGGLVIRRSAVRRAAIGLVVIGVSCFSGVIRRLVARLAVELVAIGFRILIVLTASVRLISVDGTWSRVVPALIGGPTRRDGGRVARVLTSRACPVLLHWTMIDRPGRMLDPSLLVGS